MNKNFFFLLTALLFTSLIHIEAAHAVNFAAPAIHPLDKFRLAKIAEPEDLDRLIRISEIDGGDEELNTLLHHTVLLGRPDLLLRLLKLGANPLLANVHGHTPIQVAQLTNNSEAVQVLLQHLFAQSLNSDPRLFPVAQFIINERLLNIMTNVRAFHDSLFVLNGRIDDGQENGGREHGWIREFVVLNTHRGFDGNQEIIDDCAQHANLSSLQFVLRNGVHRTGLAEALNRPDALGRTPLHHFVAAGRLSGINLLLRFGADMDLPALDGRTAFGMTIFEGTNEMRSVVLFEFLYRLVHGHEIGQRVDTPDLRDEFAQVLGLIYLYFQYPPTAITPPSLETTQAAAPTGLPIVIISPPPGFGDLGGAFLSRQ